MSSRSTLSLKSARYPAIAVLMALLVFGRTLTFDFVAFDDALHIGRNPYFHPLTIANVSHLWTASYRQVYMPVTYTVLALIAKLGELPVADAAGNRFNPYLFHAANLLLHAGNTLLVWLILWRVVRHRRSATLGAILFAVHPIAAEAVAWISSLKDLLSAMFSLSAILLYLQFYSSKNPRYGLVALATLALLLGVFAKATAIVTPAILLILVWLERRKNQTDFAVIIPLNKSRLIPLTGWFVAVIPFLLFTRSSQDEATLLVWNPLWLRPLEACDAILFYLGKIIWPAHLGIDYGRSPTWLATHGSWWCCLWLVLLIGALFLLRRRWPIVVGGFAIFVVAIAPVLGLVSFEFQWYTTVADRYVYLAMLGMALVVAELADRFTGINFKMASTGVVTALMVFGFAQAGVWQSSAALFQNAVAVNPTSIIGWQGTGSVRALAGDVDGSVAAYKTALLTQPNDVQSLEGLFEVLHRYVGGRPEALAKANVTRAAANRVLLKFPDSVLAHQQLAIALATLGDYHQAWSEFDRAIRLSPSDPAIRVQYGDALVAAGLAKEAVNQYQLALAHTSAGASVLVDAINRRLAWANQKLAPTSRP